MRVVFDCNILLQALASPQGPSGKCVQLALDGTVTLFISPFVLTELRSVAARPKIISKLGLSEVNVEELVEAIEIASVILDNVPERFTYARDRDDAHYVNLALAAGAKLIVSRDNDLLDLMDQSIAQGADFRRHYPTLRILNPVSFLNELSALGQD